MLHNSSSYRELLRQPQIARTRQVWHVTFVEPGVDRDEGQIRELARRGEAWQTSGDRQTLDYAIAKGSAVSACDYPRSSTPG
jgi:hypothetical protein